MNKSQLIEALSNGFEGNKKAAQHALESVLDTITREVSKGEKVAITGFGAFEKVIRPSRMVRNPRTGERTRAKKTAVPKFRAGAKLKAVVSGAEKPPKAPTKTGTARTSSTRKTTASSSPAKKTTTAKKTTSARTGNTSKSTAKKSAAKTLAKKSSSSTAKKSAAKTLAKKSPASNSTATKRSPAKKSSTARTSAASKTTTAKRSPAKRSSSARKTAKKS